MTSKTTAFRFFSLLIGRSLRVIVGIAILAASAEAATEAASVNGKSISMEEFEKKYRENLQYFQMRKPTRASVVQDLVKRELGILEARKLKLDSDPEVIDRMNTVLYQALLERKLGKDVEKIYVSDSDAKEYYTRNPEIRTSHIFVALAPDASVEKEKAAREKMMEIQNTHLKSGMSFAEVAQKHSEGMAAPMGGDLDYQGRDKLDPTYYDTARELKTPGKVSGIIRSQFGLHIIKLTGIRPWLEADRAQTKRLVFEEKRRALFEKLMTDLRSRYKVTINPELLKQGG
jgi:parvulin-like peptidyl-prolyl isomerase